jgi:hypothetical protein
MLPHKLILEHRHFMHCLLVQLVANFGVRAPKSTELTLATSRIWNDGQDANSEHDKPVTTIANIVVHGAGAEMLLPERYEIDILSLDKNSGLLSKLNN